MEQVLNRSLSLSPLPGHFNESKIASTSSVFSSIHTSGYASDNVRMLALAINKTVKAHITRNSSVLPTITRALADIEFDGTTVSSHISQILAVICHIKLLIVAIPL